MSLAKYKTKRGILQVNFPPIELIGTGAYRGLYRRYPLNDLVKLVSSIYPEVDTILSVGDTKEFYPVESSTITNFFEAFTIYQKMHKEFGEAWNNKNPAIKNIIFNYNLFNTENNARRETPLFRWDIPLISRRLRSIAGLKPLYNYDVDSKNVEE